MRQLRRASGRGRSGYDSDLRAIHRCQRFVCASRDAALQAVCRRCALSKNEGPQRGKSDRTGVAARRATRLAFWSSQSSKRSGAPLELIKKLLTDWQPGNSKVRKENRKSIDRQGHSGLTSRYAYAYIF